MRTSQLWNIKEYDRYTSPRHGDSEYLQKFRDWFTERPYHHTWAMDMETPMSWSARGLGAVQVDPDSRKVCLIEGCHRVLLLREKGETFFPVDIFTSSLAPGRIRGDLNDLQLFRLRGAKGSQVTLRPAQYHK